MSQRPSLRLIRPEDIRAQAHADGHVLTITDVTLRVGSGNRVRLDIAIADVRRIEFDIERDRPATLVIVPFAPALEPQVIMVGPEDYMDVSRALAIVGEQMAKLAR